MNIETEIKNIIASYDSDLIYILRRLDRLEKIVKAARALKGDLDSHDESPTHFCSYFTLTDALKELREL